MVIFILIHTFDLDKPHVLLGLVISEFHDKKTKTVIFLKSVDLYGGSLLLCCRFCLSGQGLVEFLIGAELGQTRLAHDLPSAFEEKLARIWEGRWLKGAHFQLFQLIYNILKTTNVLLIHLKKTRDVLAGRGLWRSSSSASHSKWDYCHH